MHITRNLGRPAATAAALSVVLGLAACASEEQATSGGDGPAITLDKDLIAAAEKKAAEIAGGEQIGGSIEIINENGGREGAILQAAFAPFTAATGVKINFTGTTDFNSVLASRIKAGNPPDIGTNSLGAIQEYLDQTEVLNLSDVIGEEELRSNFSDSTLDTARIDGDVYSIYQGFSNMALYYNPTVYKGPTSGTWSDVAAWTEKTAAAGTTPWCIAEEAGPATGAVGATWIQILFTKKYGAEKAAAWGSGELPWTSPEVKDAFEMFGAIAGKDENVNGGVAGSLSESFATGSNGLVSDPAKCQAVMWGTWTPSLIAASSDGVKAGENLDFVRVPASDPRYFEHEMFNANALFAFKDTPATRAFMKYIASSEEQMLLASADNWMVANTKVPSSTYSSELLQKSAETFFTPDVVPAPGPLNLSSSGVNVTYWQGVVRYLSDPSSLDAILDRIQQAQDAAGQ